MNIEYRYIADAKLEGNKLSGRAIPYESPSKKLKTSSGSEFVEIIKTGCATRSLKNNPDILCLVEHDAKKLLGRTMSNTLQAEERTDGVYISLEMPNTTWANDLKEQINRGDVAGFSFGFSNPKEKKYKSKGLNIREISDFDLVEISVVSNPAYSDTTLSLRDEDFAKEELEKQEAEKKKQEAIKLEMEIRHRINSLP